MLVCFLLAMAQMAVATPQVPEKPEPARYVVDRAAMLSLEDGVRLEEIGRELAAETGAQIVVVTVDTLGGASIEAYATTLFRSWGLGDTRKNNGVLLLIAKEDRKFRIEVGYGLESAITDGYAGSVLDAMKDEFRRENYSPAIVEAYVKLVQKTCEDYAVPAPAGAAGAVTVQEPSEESTFNVVLGIIISIPLFALLFYCGWRMFVLAWFAVVSLVKLLSFGKISPPEPGNMAKGRGYDRDHDSGGSGSSGSSGGSYGGGRSGGGGASGSW